MADSHNNSWDYFRLCVGAKAMTALSQGRHKHGLCFNTKTRNNSMVVGLKWHGQQQAVHSAESRIEVSKK